MINVDDMNKDEIDVLLRTAKDGYETAFDLVEFPNGTKRVEVVRRKALPEIRKEDLPLARSDARAYVFHTLDSFAAFCVRECNSDNSVILADCDKQTITAVIDDSLEYGQEFATFEAKIHPLFAPWLQLLNKATPVMQFALHCQQYRRSIQKPDGRELAMMFSQVRMSKNVEINKGIGAKAINGVMVSIEIAGAKKDTAVELPEDITVQCPLFVGSDPQAIELDLLVTEGREGVVVYLTSPVLEERRIQAFESMAAKLVELAPGLLVGLGRAETKPWKTVAQPNV
jgi:hypothetical protein